MTKIRNICPVSKVYKVYQTVKKTMCRRCRHMLRAECETQHWDERYEQMCICIVQVLEPNDENYPTQLNRGK